MNETNASSETKRLVTRARRWKRLGIASILLNMMLVLLLMLVSWTGKDAFFQDLDSRLVNLLAS